MIYASKCDLIYSPLTAEHNFKIIYVEDNQFILYKNVEGITILSLTKHSRDFILNRKPFVNFAGKGKNADNRPHTYAKRRP